ncbi:MAG: adenosine kinase [Waddliaceae bacterium]|nr:adenosine kinase [Waddliaceae bacterium]
MSNKYEVLGLGGCILDLVVQVSEDFLETVPGEKGGMELVGHDDIVSIITSCSGEAIEVPGGSAANAIKGISHLGIHCAMAGKVGNDKQGASYKKGLEDLEITPVLFNTDTPSAIVLCLVTPDGQRTMRTYLGASAETRGADLTDEMFHGVKLVHIEGYTLDHHNLTERAMELAKDAGALVSFDFSSFEIIKRYKERIMSLLENYVDIIFGNEDEMKTITGLPPKEACQHLGMMCDTAITLVGKKGCYVSHNNTTSHYPAIPIKHPLDTTGAGDLFASGFLYGLLKDQNMKTCAQYGAITGNAVVQTLGAEISQSSWQNIVLRTTRP